MALAQIAQDDFAVGTLRGVAQDVQPGVGVHQALNGMINDDGDVFLRGATTRLTTGPNIASEPLYWLWSGVLGTRTYVVGGGPAGLWQMKPDGTLPVIPASAGVTNPGMLTAAIGMTVYLPTLQALTGNDGTGVLTCSVWVPPGDLPAAGDTHVATIAGRLVIARGNRVAFSEPMPPGTVLSFLVDDYHELPGGTVVMGLFAQQDTLLVFTNFGLWAITNMAYDLTDAAGNVQQTLSLLVPGLSLINEGGLCPWQGRVVAPCVDKIYLVDPINPPTAISDSIAPIWNGYVSLAARPGGAKVFRDTLLLPIVDRFNAPATLLTCRLNRPVRGRYVYHPWTELAGHAAHHHMFDFYTSATGPLLIGGGHDGWIDDLTGCFREDFAGPDADDTTAEFILETRDFPTGQGQPNHLRRVRVSYSAQLGTPTNLELYVSSDGFLAQQITLDPQPITDLPSASSDPLSWWLQTALRCRYVRVRIRIPAGGVSSFVVHRVELRARAASHAR